MKMLALDGSGNDWLWDRNKFINRKFIMQEMYQNYIEGDENWDYPQVGSLTLLHSEWQKLHRVLAILSASGLMGNDSDMKNSDFNCGVTLKEFLPEDLNSWEEASGL